MGVPPPSIPRHAQQFFGAGQALGQQAGAVVAQQGHALGLGGGAQCGFGGALVHQRSQGVVGQQQLENAAAPGVAGVAAVAAAYGVQVAVGAGLAAVGAEFAQQPLRQHAQQRAAEQKGLDTHVGQARDGAGGVVGVQGGQHQVAGERGLDGDLRGFEVAAQRRLQSGAGIEGCVRMKKPRPSCEGRGLNFIKHLPEGRGLDQKRSVV